MEDNPDVKINIETFSWNDFYTKWTTGLASGNVPDMSTALPAQVAEMIDADALVPINDLIDEIGRDKFAEAAISEGTVNNYIQPNLEFDASKTKLQLLNQLKNISLTQGMVG